MGQQPAPDQSPRPPRRSRPRGRWTTRVALTAVAGLLVAVTGSPASAAAPDQVGAGAAGRVAGPPAGLNLPAGWSLADGADGPELVWTPPTAVPRGDAQVEILADGHSLGPATVSSDGRRVSVPVNGVPSDPASLQVIAAGRRLDRPAGSGLAAEPATPEPAQRPIATDPGTPGPFAVATDEYVRPGLAISGMPAPVEIRAVVVSPVAAPGARPLVLFLHGRHASCFTGGPDGQASGEWPCPAGWAPIPSHRGYLQAQRLLASQGYDTVSISADGINGQDFRQQDGGARARSLLIRAHLTLWAGWTGTGRADAPPIVRQTSPADLSRVLLIGHSRGGDGANRAALDSLTARDPQGRPVPWRISGQLLVAPTVFGFNPAPGVPTAVLLPYCDGDVFDLQGQVYVDGGRDLSRDPVLRSALLVRGANHNYFNSEWTPGAAKAPSNDDWFEQRNPVCGTEAATSERLTPAEQRQVGATYAAASAAVFIGQDADVLPLLDGTGVRAPSVGPAKVIAHAIGARRHPLVRPGAGLVLAGTGGVTTTSCAPGDDPFAAGSCRPSLPGPNRLPVAPHLLSGFGLPAAAQRQFTEISWTRAGGRADLGLPRPVSLVGDDAVAMRIFTSPGAGSTSFAVRVTDTAGRSSVLGPGQLSGLPPAAGSGKAWAREVRVPVDVAALRRAGVDPGAIATVTLAPTSATGRIWLVDAWGWQPGLSRAAVPVLPRADVGSLEVAEGDAGSRTVTVPIRISGPTDRGGRLVLYVVDQRTFEPPNVTIVDLPAGRRSVDVPVTVVGNTLDDFPRAKVAVLVLPLTGIATGNYLGGLTILDDDPAPTLTLIPVADRVTEGASLTWRATLSGPTQVNVFALFKLVPPTGAAQLFTDDVSPQWLLDHGLASPPDPPVPLSALEFFEFFDLQPGQVSADITIPTLVDDRAEGTEQLVLRAERLGGFDPRVPAGTLLVGTVSD